MSANTYLGALPKGSRGETAILGVPFDGTASYRAGARFGPNAIREGSVSLETYSPFLDRELDEMDYVDWGDLEVAPGSAEKMTIDVERAVNEIVGADMSPVVLGGEHTVTLGVIRSMVKKYPNLYVLQLDAHADYRDKYMGESISHATVMRRVMEYIPADRVIRLGLRSGTREELAGMGMKLPLGFEGGMRNIEGIIKHVPDDAPLYVTVDLDVFDPSLIPGVGNPEPDGLTYREFIQLARGLVWKNLVGFDVVELAPQYDATGVSAVVAASVVRELVLCLQ